MPATVNLTTDELLSTTKAVRKRLDFERPVPREAIEECLALAQFAPTGSNSQSWHFVVVSDAGKRASLARLYKRGWDMYSAMPASAGGSSTGDAERDATQTRVRESALYLAEHMAEAPIHVIPCAAGRVDRAPALAQAGFWGSIFPAAWSFMLAARTRGLGTVLTSLHLVAEQEAADVLGIPYDKVTQAALIPVAYYKGESFKASPRAPLDTMVHWESW